MNFEEKLKELNIDKGQIIIFSVMALIITFVFYGLFSASGDDVEVYNDLDVPQHKSITEYETKLEAYAKENQAKEDTHSLNFDRGGVFGIDSTDIKETEREKLEAKVDSMLNLSKREDSSYLINKEESITDQIKQGKTVQEMQSNNNHIGKKVVKEKPLTTKEQIYIARRKQRDERLIREQELKNKTPSSSIISEGIKKVNIIVKATIDFDQTITNNGSVRMRLLEDLVLNDGTIPEDTSVWGTCTFNSNGRVTIYVNAINYNDKLHYVHLDAFDFRDGQKGLIVGANNVREALEKEAESELTRETSNAGRVLNSVTRVFKKRDVKVQLFDEHHIYLKN